MSENYYAYRFKLIMLGEPGVGKTSLFRRYSTGDFFGPTDSPPYCESVFNFCFMLAQSYTDGEPAGT